MTDLTDRFGRAHQYLRISLSERCNLRCFYCMPVDGEQLSPKSDLMSYEEIIAITQQFVDLGIKTVRLTGGEPLVRKDFDCLCRQLAELPITIKLTTNGILLDRYFHVLKSCNILDLNISLDTLDRQRFEKITHRDNFSQVYQNINTAIAQGFRVKINIVLIKGVNDDEILDFVALTQDLDITVKFIEFMPFKDNNWQWNKGIPYADIVTRLKAKHPNIQQLDTPKNSTSLIWQIPDFKGKIGMINTVTVPFCGGCNRLRLTANGRLKNCLFSQGEVDLLSAFRKGDSIVPLITDSLQAKEKTRGGIDNNKDFLNKKNDSKGRSMLTIGG